MKIFDIVNSKNEGLFVLASDSKEALFIAKKVGHIRKSSNKILDVTDGLIDQNGVKELLEGTKRGIVACKIRRLSIFDILSGEGQSNSTWVLAREVDIRELYESLVNEEIEKILK